MDEDLDIKNDFLVYVRWKDSLFHPRSGQQVPVRVCPETSFEELKRKALDAFETENAKTIDLDYILFSLRGRRVLDNAITMQDLNVQPDEVMIIHWD